MAYTEVLAHQFQEQDVYVCVKTFTATSQGAAEGIAGDLSTWIAENPPPEGEYDTEKSVAQIWMLATGLWIIIYILTRWYP